MTSRSRTRLILLLSAVVATASAFLSKAGGGGGSGNTMAFLPQRQLQQQRQQQLPSSSSPPLSSSTARKAIEQLEFTIYPDGRIEETVRGIKGENCHSVTDEINQHLGEVVASRPTEELYENEIVIDQTVTETVGGGGDGGGGGWESTW